MTETKLRFEVLELNLAGLNGWTFLRLNQVLRNMGESITSLTVYKHPDITPIRLSSLVEIFENLANLKRIVNKNNYRIIFDHPLPEDLCNATMGIMTFVEKLSCIPDLELISNASWSARNLSDNFVPRWILQQVTFDKVFEVDESFFRNMIIKQLYFIDYDEEAEDFFEGNQFLNEVLETQTELEKINLNVSDDHGSHFECESLLLSKIANITSLTKLVFKLARNVGADEVCALENLQNLKVLCFDMFEYGTSEMFRRFMQIPFPCLEILEIEGTWPEIDVEFLREMMCANWSNLQKLYSKKKPKQSC